MSKFTEIFISFFMNLDLEIFICLLLAIFLRKYKENF